VIIGVKWYGSKRRGGNKVSGKLKSLFISPETFRGNKQSTSAPLKYFSHVAIIIPSFRALLWERLTQ